MKVKSALNRELVATYEVTISVYDNASDVVDRSVSVPNGKGIPVLAFVCISVLTSKQGSAAN